MKKLIPDLLERAANMLRPDQEYVYQYNYETKTYSKIVKTRLALGGGIRGKLHRETCDCGTIPYHRGPRDGCPGPKPVVKEPQPVPLKITPRMGLRRCPSCRAGWIEQSPHGAYHCNLCGAWCDGDGNRIRR